MSPGAGSSSSWCCRTTVKQLHGSSHHVSTANELDYFAPPVLKGVQFKILLWKAADQLGSLDVYISLRIWLGVSINRTVAIIVSNSV